MFIKDFIVNFLENNINDKNIKIMIFLTTLLIYPLIEYLTSTKKIITIKNKYTYSDKIFCCKLFLTDIDDNVFTVSKSFVHGLSDNHKLWSSLNENKTYEVKVCLISIPLMDIYPLIHSAFEIVE